MPTEVFLRLPAEKQAKIREAIRQEFARVPMEEVSINRIVQQAGISRGSIYQYYEDKRDMLDDVFTELRQFLMDLGEQLLIRHQGDLMEAFVDVFDQATSSMVEAPWYPMCIKLFSHMRIQPRREEESFRDHCLKDIQSRILPQVDWSLYGTPELLAKQCFVEMLIAQWVVAFAACLEEPSERAVQRQKLVIKFEMIKQGTLARKEQSC